MRGVARGSSNKIIAADLNISVHTVKNHLKHPLQAERQRSDTRRHDCAQAWVSVPWTGLEASTRAYAKIIDEVNKLPLSTFRRPDEPTPTRQ